MQPMTPPDTSKHRLLQSALRVFAEQGYVQASVRDICAQSEMNVAAVNYHFGDKAGLYREVFRSQLQQLVDSQAFLEREDALLALRRFYSRMLERSEAAEQSRSLFFRLAMREQLEPSGVLDESLQESLRQSHQGLLHFVAQQTGLSVSDPTAQRLALFVAFMGSPLQKHPELLGILAPAVSRDAEGLRATVEHLARCALSLLGTAGTASSREGEG
jgi:AcrR family transcriptional regulator